MAPKERTEAPTATTTDGRPPTGRSTRGGNSTVKARQTTLQLRESLANTLEGLRAFRASLERSGLPEALKSYQALQHTLQAQHAWSVQNHRVELTAHWRSLASEAEAIADLLRPYVYLMRAVAELEGARARATAGGSSRSVSEADARELARALLASCQVSRRHLRDRDPQVSAAAERLASHDRLQARGWGRSRSYGSTPAQRRELEEKLLQLLESAERSQTDT